MYIKKETGGSSIRWHDGAEYHWPEDGAVIEVPDELGRDLLRIDGGEHTRADPAEARAEAGEGCPGSGGGEGRTRSRKVSRTASSRRRRVVRCPVLTGHAD